MSPSPPREPAVGEDVAAASVGATVAAGAGVGAAVGAEVGVAVGEVVINTGAAVGATVREAAARKLAWHGMSERTQSTTSMTKQSLQRGM